MYKNIEILNKKEHKSFSYTPATDLIYAKDLNLIPITFSEVKSLCCEFPIVIIMQGNTPQLMILTGVESNGAINENGKWKGKYIPSFLRRYPFTLIQDEANETLHIGFDSESGLFNSDEGNALFDSEGAPTDILENMKNFLAAYHEENQITENILKHLKEKGLVDAAEFTIKRENEEKQKVDGFFIINKQKFFKQEDAFLLEAVKNGWMEIIELHTLSLENIGKLSK
ncbi:SapC family protein [Sulfurovum sp. NBC37-1]|uniref:SapC family protein n=1 Tax=Sulfurovum sp. (strain NBC37-1) TaxID=387093 RepID=UPI000158770E|nr:SapC family protein [Sulfurovum sp. NBC37-1]BAF71298.1 conserved hypothetical protein [Sulfurovum sp. NBC37-1]